MYREYKDFVKAVDTLVVFGPQMDRECFFLLLAGITDEAKRELGMLEEQEKN